jgi:Predicted membrane protein (DUF2207).
MKVFPFLLLILTIAAFIRNNGESGQIIPSRNDIKIDMTNRVEVTDHSALEFDLSAIRESQFWEQISKEIGFLIGIFILLIYYVFTWFKVGRNPKKPPVVPLFDSPHGWSPVLIRYLYKRAWDDKIFTVSALSMAIKNVLIIQKKKKFQLFGMENKGGLSEDERIVYYELFSGQRTVPVNHSGNSKIFYSMRLLRKYLDNTWNLKAYFNKNIKYIITAIVLSVIVLTAYWILTGSDVIIIFFLLLPFFVFGFFFFYGGLQVESGFTKVFLLLFGSFFIFPMVTGLIVMSVKDLISGVFAVFSLGGFLVYAFSISAFTPLGIRVRSELEGFKMYLEIADESQLGVLITPEHTVERFEAMLPYAVALDVENQWSMKFHSVLQQDNYSPAWYAGDKSQFTYSNFAGSLAASFTSSFDMAGVEKFD